MTPIDYRLKRLDEAPPGGFDCYVPETGMRWAHEPSFQKLAEKVFDHLKANNLDATGAFDRIQRSTTSRLRAANETRWIEAYTPEVKNVAQSFVGFAFGAKAYVQIQYRLQRGLPVFIDSAAAEARATLCAACPKNVRETEPSALAAARDAVIRTSVGDRSTSLDGRLGKCAVCACQLKSAVHFHADIIRVGTPDAMIPSFPQHCWKKKLANQR